MLDAPHPSRAPVTCLHLVDDEHDPVVVADAAYALEELRRRDDETAFALDGLDHDCRDGFGGDGGHERTLERSKRSCRSRPSVVLREREPVDLGRERTEPFLAGMR